MFASLRGDLRELLAINFNEMPTLPSASQFAPSTEADLSAASSISFHGASTVAEPASDPPVTLPPSAASAASTDSMPSINFASRAELNWLFRF